MKPTLQSPISNQEQSSGSGAPSDRSDPVFLRPKRPQDSAEAGAPTMTIAPGERVVWRERLVDLDGVISPTHVSVRDVVNGTTEEAPIGELRPFPSGSLIPADLTKIPEAEWKIAKERAHALIPYIRKGRIPHGEIHKLSNQLGLSERQVKRLLPKLRRSSRVLTLVRSRPGPPKGSSRLSPEQEKAIRDVLRDYYDQPTPKLPPDLLDNLAARCRRLKCRTPSLSTVRRRIRVIEEERAFHRREARAATHQRHTAHTGHHDVNRPLVWVQIDHTPIDEIVLSDDDYRAPLGRPWLTCNIDLATRCILGTYLSLDRPYAESVGCCLVQTMLPKDEWLKRIGLAGVEWPMYGTPKVLHADNAWEFDCVALRRGCHDYNIKPCHRPKGTPHFGGHIERLLGSFAQRIHALPGTTFSNPKQRDDYKSEVRAKLTLREVRDWITCEIMRYHSTPHRGLGQKTPRHAWVQALTHEGRYCPPPVPVAGDALLLQFLPCELRQVHREGVYFDTLTYVPADPDFDLSPYVGSIEPAEIYFDRRDISFIYLRAHNGEFITMRPNVSEFRPISRTEFARYRAMEREAAHDPSDLTRRIAAVEEQERLIGRSRSATRQAHRQQQREASRLELAAQSRLPRAPLTSVPEEAVTVGPDDEIPSLAVERWD